MVIAVAVSGYLGLEHVARTSEDVLLRDAQIAERALSARASSLQLRRYEKDYFLNMGAADKQAEYLEKWKTAHGDLTEQLTELDGMIASQKDHDTLKTMSEDLAAYTAGFEKVGAAVRAGTVDSPQAANIQIAQYKTAIRRMETTAAALGGASDYRMRERMKLLTADVKDTNLQMTIAALLAVVVAVLMGVRLSRSVTVPVHDMVSVARRTAAGDLSSPVEVTAHDEMGDLQAALKAINERLVRGGQAATS
jgi:methyl-accepting chemotaxis protein